MKVNVHIKLTEWTALCEWFDALDITCDSVIQHDILDSDARVVVEFLYQFELSNPNHAMLLKLAWGGGKDKIHSIGSEEELIQVFGTPVTQVGP